MHQNFKVTDVKLRKITDFGMCGGTVHEAHATLVCLDCDFTVALRAGNRHDLGHLAKRKAHDHMMDLQVDTTELDAAELEVV